MNKKVFALVVAIIIFIVSAPIIMVIVWDEEPSTDLEENTVEKNIMEENNIEKENNTEENTTEKNTTEENVPYMPNGFSYVKGEVETGYTIVDSYGNTYVWVPVENGELIVLISIKDFTLQNTNLLLILSIIEMFLQQWVTEHLLIM